MVVDKTEAAEVVLVALVEQVVDHLAQAVLELLLVYQVQVSRMVWEVQVATMVVLMMVPLAQPIVVMVEWVDLPPHPILPQVETVDPV